MKNHPETPTNKPLRSRARANNTAPANKQAPRPTKLILRGVAVRPTEEWRVLAARSSARHGWRSLSLSWFRVPNVKTTMKNHLETPTNKPLRSRARANNTAPANKQATRTIKLILQGVAVRPTEEWRVLAARSSARHGCRYQEQQPSLED